MIYRRKQKKRFFGIKKVLFRLCAILIALTVGLIVICENKLEDFVPEFVRDQSEIMSAEQSTER